MTSLRFDDLRQYSDTLRTRSGEAVTVRFVEPRDAEELQNYDRSLSARSRYNRFLGAMSELPKSLLDHFTHVGARRFVHASLPPSRSTASRPSSARRVTCFTREREASNSACRSTTAGRATASGCADEEPANAAPRRSVPVSMFGDTLRSNNVMIALARKSGFAFGNHPDDWKLVRFEKEIDVAPKDIPCASWRLAAEARQVAVA